MKFIVRGFLGSHHRVTHRAARPVLRRQFVALSRKLFFSVTRRLAECQCNFLLAR